MTDWPGTPDLPARDIVHAYLAEHARDRQYALTEPVLANACGLSLRAIQGIVEELRRDGIPVCTGNPGVWLTNDPAEVREQYRRLRRRGQRQLANLRRMLRTAEVMERPLVMPWAEEAA